MFRFDIMTLSVSSKINKLSDDYILNENMDPINRSNNHHAEVGCDEDYHTQGNADNYLHEDIEAVIHQLRKDVEEIHSRT